MNLFSHICVALVYAGTLICYFQSEKRYALFFAISASIALVLSGLSTGAVAYFLCVALALMDIALITCILLKKSNIKITTLSIFHIPLIVLWFIYYLR